MTLKNVTDFEKVIEPGNLYRIPGRSFFSESEIPTPYKSNHASNLVELDNGDLLCAWFAGTSEGSSDTKIVLSRMDADTNKWSLCIRVSEDFTCSEQNPFLFDFGKGRVWLVHTAQKARQCTRQEWEDLIQNGQASGDYTMQETAEIRVLESLDYGHHFHERNPLNSKSGAFCRQPFIRLSNKELLLGMWYSVNMDGDFERGALYGKDYSACLISDNDGETWTEYPVPGSIGRVHMQPIELEPGKLLALFRSRYADRIYKSYSHDYGRTWSEPIPTELPNNNASIQAKKLHNGHIALIYNHTPYLYNDASAVRWPANSRNHISVAISKDGGETWPYIRVVEPGEEFYGEQNKSCNLEYSYPSIIQTKDDKLHVTYTFAGRKCIKHVVIDENWVKGGKTD